MPSHPLIRLIWSLPPHLKVVFAAVVLVALASLLSSLLLVALAAYGALLRSRNGEQRAKLLKGLDIDEKDAKGRRRTVGFFHPYWCVLAALRNQARMS
jgi:CHASE2 domain-containing sensor protein